MLNKNPKYEALTLRISKHKVVFRKYPAENDASVFYADVWQKQKDNDGKKTYSLQIFHKEWQNEFAYSFDVDGMWKCLDDALSAEVK